ncbi:hypothetical protein KBI23_04065 [bacterium]|jgi:hypothetical protein|nr:hypothetical protein [bacterium]MBP9809953.1 hypothetical protein [bacterium]
MQQPPICVLCGRSGFAGYSAKPELGSHICKDCVELHNQKMLEDEWFRDEHELKLMILQVLFSARHRDQGRGYPVAMVSDCIGLERIFDTRPARSWLRRNKDIEAEQGKSFITDQGAVYLLEQIPALRKLFDAE